LICRAAGMALGFGPASRLGLALHRKSPEDIRMANDVKILIVDDDLSFRTVMRSACEDLGDVVVADSGRAAIQILKTSPIDFVFSDIVMLDGDGIELLEWVKASPDHAQIPVVLITGHTTATPRALELGAFAVLNKPFDLEQITDVFQRARA